MTVIENTDRRRLAMVLEGFLDGKMNNRNLVDLINAETFSQSDDPAVVALYHCADHFLDDVFRAWTIRDMPLESRQAIAVWWLFLQSPSTYEWEAGVLPFRRGCSYWFVSLWTKPTDTPGQADYWPFKNEEAIQFAISRLEDCQREKWDEWFSDR